MPTKIEVQGLNFYYGKFQALIDVGMSIKDCTITAIIGPSGCGKSTLLRCFNRLNDLIEGVRISGSILLDGVDIYGGSMDLTGLRRRVGMVFQRPNPFPLSVRENVAYGLRVHRGLGAADIEAEIERTLGRVFLWDELKDRLHRRATVLSPEQQQRLCIARALAIEPEVLLMDEPCSALDPAATQGIEELIQELKKRLAIVIVTHNMQQAARVSDEAGFMLLGELVEFGLTGQVFTNPRDSRTEEYVTGRYG